MHIQWTRLIAKLLVLLSLLLFLVGTAFAAGPVVLNTFVARGNVTIGGTGFVLPVSVTLNGKKLTTVSATTTRIVAKLSGPLAQGTYRLVVSSGSAQTVTTVTTSGSVSGFVNADCTIQTGTGFSCTYSDGTYTLTFPRGTFNGANPPVVVVTPFYISGNALNFSLYSTTYPGDGSAAITFSFSPNPPNASPQVPFTFIVVNGH